MRQLTVPCAALELPLSVEPEFCLMLRSATSSLLRMAARPSASMLLTRTKTTGQIGVLTGAPKDELERKVYIFRPAKSAGQHASAAVPGYSWKLSFEKKDRWINPLMGWTSSADSLAGQTTGNMNFESKDAAVAFAEKNGEPSVLLRLRYPISVFFSQQRFQVGKSYWRSRTTAKFAALSHPPTPHPPIFSSHPPSSGEQGPRQELRRELPVGGRQ